MFFVLQALHDGKTAEDIHNLTKIDLWFLHKLERIVKMEKKLGKLDW